MPEERRKPVDRPGPGEIDYAPSTLSVVVNYLLGPDGWTAELIELGHGSDAEPDVLDWVGTAPTARAIFDAVTSKLDAVSDRRDVTILTLHTIAGDPESWLEIAGRSGFGHLVRNEI